MAFQTDPDRPLMRHSIEEITAEADDESGEYCKADITDELAHRRGSKKVRELCKQLGCQWRPGRNVQLMAAAPVVAVVAADIADAFGLTDSPCTEVL